MMSPPAPEPSPISTPMPKLQQSSDSNTASSLATDSQGPSSLMPLAFSVSDDPFGQETTMEDYGEESEPVIFLVFNSVAQQNA